MNSYMCYYGFDYNNKIVKTCKECKYLTTACWAGIKNLPLSTKHIYIYKYGKETDYLYRIIKLINNITPCKIVNINNKKYIKYTLLESNLKKSDSLTYYNKNLLLLNFIRYNWYKPFNLDYDNFIKNILKSSRGKDSLKFMLECIKENIKPFNIRPELQYGNHSTVYKNIILKTKKELYNIKNLKKMASFISKDH